jgi:glyoxylase-like metal-dependent hydrolase (beta-lactamase superfamily II)
LKIERVLANNPGPFTGPGTNTWILEDDGSAVVIDPGPVDQSHSDELLRRLEGRRLVGVMVTHTHLDHAPLANPLARELQVPAIGYSSGPDFEPDIRVDEGSSLDVGALDLRVIHTPGHSDDHLCFRVGDVLFTGDHIMGGSSVMVERMGLYLESLRKLRNTGLERLLPGHGEEMGEPDVIIDWYLEHRRQRHEEICAAIARGAGTIDEVVETVYADVSPALHRLAAVSVQAHVDLLAEEGRIAWDGRELAVLPPSDSWNSDQ